MNNQLVFNISQIPQGSSEFVAEVKAPSIGLDEKRFSKAVKVESLISKSAEEIIISSKIYFNANCICDRCTSDFERNFLASFQILASNNLEEKSNKFDEEITFSPTTTKIDITNGIKESILLSFPQKILCNEDCAGLCQYCGKNLNEAISKTCNCHEKEIDPRFAKLKDLLSNN